jgi:hypothetical protein
MKMQCCKRLFSHKFLELEISKYDMEDTCNWYKFLIEHTRQCDHAGFYLSIELFGWVVSLVIYDSRHWDFGKKMWMEYPNS